MADNLCKEVYKRIISCWLSKANWGKTAKTDWGAYIFLEEMQHVQRSGDDGAQGGRGNAAVLIEYSIQSDAKNKQRTRCPGQAGHPRADTQKSSARTGWCLRRD